MTFTLLDGGMGRELLRIGAPFQQPKWSALLLQLLAKQPKPIRISFSLDDSALDIPILRSDEYAKCS